MRTIKTGPMFWVKVYSQTFYPEKYIIFCEQQKGLKIVVYKTNDRDTAYNFMARLNVAAYRWAISENE